MVNATCPVCEANFLVPERYFTKSVWDSEQQVLHRLKDDRAYYYHRGCPSNGVIRSKKTLGS